MENKLAHPSTYIQEILHKVLFAGNSYDPEFVRSWPHYPKPEYKSWVDPAMPWDLKFFLQEGLELPVELICL